MTDLESILSEWDLAANLISPDRKGEKWSPLPHQIPPDPPWRGWILMGGRGAGKTATCAKYVHDHVHGPPCLSEVPGGHWISIVAPTLGDAVTSCVMGPSGLRAHEPGVRVVNRPGGISAIWPNGTEAKLFGASSPEDVERFRAGGNRCLAWMEEFAAMRYLDAVYEQMRYGLRVGPRPHWVGSSTPRSRKIVKQMLKDPNLRVTHGKTNENPHLNEDVKNELYGDYAGTRMGRQELEGELLEDVEGALWKGETIEAYRLKHDDVPEDYDRIIVAIDPAAKSEEGSDETGIIVAAMVRHWDRLGILYPERSHAFILHDGSGKYAPSAWAKRAIALLNRYKGDMIIAEINNGGEMVKHVVHSIDDTVPYKAVTATRGKTKRAEPVSSLYIEGRVHHVGMFEKLEDQMTQWDPMDEDPSWSPDRMDAMVWAITELLIGRKIVTQDTLENISLKKRR